MISSLPLTAHTGPSLTFGIGALRAGMASVLYGLGLTFDVRGMTTHQGARMRARVQRARLSKGVPAEPVYPVSPEVRLRMSGGGIALAGIALCAAGIALLHLG